MSGWTQDFPQSEGNFWFYGSPHHGLMGQDYSDDAPPIPRQMYFVKIRKISNGFAVIIDGQLMRKNKFDKENHIAGYVGYWKPAELPDHPEDVDGVFK